MKVYFGVIIAVLVIVILLLFFVLYKIYKLHVKSVQDIAEQQELLSATSDSKESSLQSVDPAFLSEAQSYELLHDGGIQGKQEIDISVVQPDVKDLSDGVVSRNDQYPFPRSYSMKNKNNIKILLQYDKQRSILKLIVKHVDGKPRSRVGSSETYIDIQVSAYRFRTYRNPGYRRPVRAVIKKNIEFRLDRMELKTTYLLLFLLRYDPFSRLKVDGEVVFKLSEVLTEGFVEGVQLELIKEFAPSKQEFTAFIFRPN